MTGFTGTYADRSFCLTCGGRVTSIREDEVEVMIGTLDEASEWTYAMRALDRASRELAQSSAIRNAV